MKTLSIILFFALFTNSINAKNSTKGNSHKLKVTRVEVINQSDSRFIYIHGHKLNKLKSIVLGDIEITEIISVAKNQFLQKKVGQSAKSYIHKKRQWTHNASEILALLDARRA